MEMNDIGSRITYLRKLGRLTRIYIREKYNISQNTLRKWEENNLNIPEEKIDLICYLFNSEGVTVKKEWIKTGRGESPVFSVNHENLKFILNESEDNRDDIIAFEEMKLLMSTNKNKFVNLLLDNDSMFPYYQKNSWIIGKKSSNNLDTIGRDCIIKMKDSNSLTFRRVGFSDKKKCFNLYILNTYDTNFSDPVYYDVEVDFIATITWIRKIYEQK